MKLPKPLLGRAVIEAIQESSVEFLKDKMRERIGAEKFDAAQASGIILDAPEIFRETYVDPHTGRTMLGKNVADNKVPLFRGKILDKAPDFWGVRFRENNPDAGPEPQIGEVVWFVPNETMAIDAARKYHLLNDCDIVAIDGE